MINHYVHTHYDLMISEFNAKHELTFYSLSDYDVKSYFSLRHTCVLWHKIAKRISYCFYRNLVIDKGNN